MKLQKIFNLMVLGLTLTVASSGCRKKPYGVTPLKNSAYTHGGDSTPIGQSLPLAPPANGLGTDNIGSTKTGGIPMTGDGHPGWNADPTALQAQTIHFDYDKSAIKTSEQPKLDEVANYLKSHSEAAVKVEGNCDERGTEEYNRSLGERRALAAREYLVRLGIDPGRVDTISYGEDKPAATGHDESAWSQNRRDDFVVLTPPK